tara:strand:- start:138 stop:299 length:162 start_codon:yes stop_codon:yes gene_type:complete
MVSIRTRAVPPAIAGRERGSTRLKKVLLVPAPRELAADLSMPDWFSKLVFVNR